MRNITFLIFFFFFYIFNAQTVEDDFEGSGTITSWFGDDCALDTNLSNPYKTGINTSNTVLQYNDTGGQYANIRFDVATNFDLTTKNSFSLKVYVPSSGITGTQLNKISLKLQDGSLEAPWSTQSEIIRDIVLDEWQEVIFDFENATYTNLDGASPPPMDRNDFNRVVIQINGENNTDKVLAYIDDVFHFDSVDENPVFDTLVWSDEFDGTGSVNSSKWFHQTQLIAGDSWANGEVQHYTTREVNSYVSNGTLKIKAIKETFSDQGVQKEYTSARLNSKYAFKYGRVEVRAKLPSVAGTWPAIWLLGKNINEDGTYWDLEGFGSASWPWCGEIDIMEPDVAKTQILGTWHWDNGSGYQYNSKAVPLTNAEASDNFHDYVLEWDADSMRIYLDNILINEMPSVDPFNQEFFILLNVAMGGNLGGTISPSFTNDSMEIDYVRVFQESSLSTEKNIEEHISFYPNPANNILNISTKHFTSSKVNLRVTDMSGRVVYEKEQITKNRKISYDISSLSQGLYFATFVQDYGIINTFKFIKK